MRWVALLLIVGLRGILSKDNRLRFLYLSWFGMRCEPLDFGEEYLG